MLSSQVISCHHFAQQTQIFAAKFDTVIIGCNGGLLPTGDFHKNGHFPLLTRTFSRAESQFQVSKNDAERLPIQKQT